jgi:hypothetical protein
MATPVINNGVFVRDSTIDLQSSLDTFNMFNISKNMAPTDIGPIAPWIMTQQVQAPIYTMDEFRATRRIPVDNPDGRYTYQMPATNDMPKFTRDLDPDNTTKGQGGVPFRIAINRRAYGMGAVLTYDKFAGLEMVVRDIKDNNNGEFIYTVSLINTGTDKYLPNDVITPQTSVFRVTSAIGEYGERFDDMTIRSSYREFYNWTSNVEATFSYECTSRAAMIMKNNKRSGSKDGLDVKELWKFNDPDDIKDISIVGLSSLIKKMGWTTIMKKVQDGSIWYGYNNMIEMEGMNKIATDIETYGMWGKGGLYKNPQDPAGRDSLRFSPGIWRQLDSAYKRTYNIGQYIPEILENATYNYLNGRVDFLGPDPQRKYIVQTGIAGMKQMNVAIKNMANNSGLVQNASDIGAISGSPLGLDFGYAFQSYTVPFLANFKFQVNPAFDNVEANTRENPMVNGYRLSSYIYVIYEVNEGIQDNIATLENTSLDYNMQWGYVPGRWDPKTNSGRGVASSSLKPGYTTWMTQMHKNYWILDPTKVLKVVPINPVTLLPFGSFL